MDSRLGILLIVVFLIVIIGVKFAFGVMGMLFSKVGIALIIVAVLGYMVHKKLKKNPDSEESE